MLDTRVLRCGARFRWGRSWMCRESMPARGHRWQRCAPVPAHMCKDGRPRGRTVGAFAHVRASLSHSQRCALVTTRRHPENHRADARCSRGEERICANDPATVSNVVNWKNYSIFFLDSEPSALPLPSARSCLVKALGKKIGKHARPRRSSGSFSHSSHADRAREARDVRRGSRTISPSLPLRDSPRDYLGAW